MGEWKQGSMPKRMRAETKTRKWCAKCGAHSHTASEHDDIKEKSSYSPQEATKIMEENKSRVPATQKRVITIQVSDLVMSKRQCKKALKKVLSHKQRRQARKQFKRLPFSHQAAYKRAARGREKSNVA